MKELGELLGWVIAISYAGTMLNYILKFVNKVTEKLHKEKHLFSNNKPDYWQKNCRNCTKSIFLKKLFAYNCAM